mgnify:CR=1 FL=1
MKTFLAHGLLLSSIICSMAVNAQQDIPLSNDEITRFGIVFTSVQAMDGNTGMRIPATVINSPLSASTLSARFEGVLTGWNVMPGENVEANEILGVINSQEVLGIQQEWIMADGAQLEAEFNLGKDEMLLAEGVISEQRMVQTRRNYQQARINAQAARKKLQMAGFTDSQMKDLLETGEGLGLYYIRTPAAGTISHLAINAGVYASDNTELVSFSSGNLWLRAQLPARLGQQLQTGQQVRLADSTHTLTLRQQDFAADENSQMIDVYAEFNQPVARLPGQVVSLILTPQDGGVLVPGDAVVHSGNLTQVFVRNAAGVEVRTLSLIPVGNAYLAQEGINAGDTVVTQGAAQLKGIQLGLGGE